MITSLDKCVVCGKPATGYVNVTANMASSVPSRFELRCAEHGGIMPSVELRSQADIDRIAALETERDTLKAKTEQLESQLFQARARPVEHWREVMGLPETIAADYSGQRDYTAEIISQFRMQFAQLPRPLVMAFARIMDEKLAEKDALGYPGWRDTDIGFSELEDEATELYHARSSGNKAHIASEAADVALVAMILWDLDCSPLKHDGRGRAKESGAN